MPRNFSKSEWDAFAIGVFVLAFGLPLTLLIPNFSIMSYVPKYQITRFPAAGQYLTWHQLNVALVAILVVFFCFYLEIRKRRLDDIVENILIVSQAAEATIEVEKDRQSAAMKKCVDMLDASAEHYEHLVLLHEELRRRNGGVRQAPPSIESSLNAVPEIY